MTIKTYLFVALGAFAAFYLFTWLNAIHYRRGNPAIAPTWYETFVGFITNFFDTLGIGSFATTTTLYRLRNVVPDELLPGTLNVGHTLPTITQAFIFIAVVEVEMKTLILLIAAAVLGMWLGAGVVVKLPRRTIQIGMGIALLVAAAFTLKAIFDPADGNGTALSLAGSLLVLGIIGNFVLGALMSLGIGLYGPCLVMISLLGMNPRAAFPIMMGSCAFLMSAGSAQFIRKEGYSLRAAIGLAIGGIPAVLIAVYIVKSLNLYYVRWLVVIVVIYTALSLLRSAMVEQKR